MTTLRDRARLARAELTRPGESEISDTARANLLRMAVTAAILTTNFVGVCRENSPPGHRPARGGGRGDDHVCDTILLAQRTRELLSGAPPPLIERPDIVLKGKTDPVRVYTTG